MSDATQPRMARGRMLPAGVLVAALFALLAFAPIASASPDPVESGYTKLVLNKNWFKYLKTFGIKVQKVKPAKQKGNKQFTFKATEGSMDPTNGLGRIKVSGGLKFKAGKKSAVVKKMVLDTAHNKLIAKVSGKKLTLATTKGLSYSRAGFGVKLKLNKVKLTKAAANQLNKKTGYKKGKPKPFLKNKLIAKAWGEAQPATVAILGEQASTELTLAKAAVDKLGSVGVELSLIPPATLAGISKELSPIAAFPVTGGDISPSADAGTVMHSGGLQLEQNLGPFGVTTLKMKEIWLELGSRTASVEVEITNPVTEELNLGSLGRASIADIDLSGAVITEDPANRKISVQNGYATLQAVTAATLNQVFAEPVKAGEVFQTGDPLGHFSFTVQTQ